MGHLRKAALAVGLVGAFALGAFARPAARQLAGPHLFNQVFNLVSTKFVDSLDTSALYDKAARGLVEELRDPYADLYDPDQLKEFAVMAEGRYGGVGMLVEEQAGSVLVSRVFPHTPAEEAGVQQGDRIVGLNGEPTAGWSARHEGHGQRQPAGRDGPHRGPLHAPGDPHPGGALHHHAAGRRGLRAAAAVQ
jgi:carboxyl-terminal processing protease